MKDTKAIFATLAILCGLMTAVVFVDASWADKSQANGNICHRLVISDATVDVDGRLLEECGRSFAEGDARAGFWLGEHYSRKDMDGEAAEYYRKSAEMGDAWSSYTIGIANLFEKANSEGGFDGDVKESLEHIRNAANSGYGQAQFFYAHVFDNVRGAAERDFSLAWKYYNLAAENGHAAAMMKVASIYLHFGQGDGCVREPREPHPPLTDEEYAHLRNKYVSAGVVCNREKGLFYLTNAARTGDPFAMFALASFYYRVDGDYAKAEKWLLRAALWEDSLLYEELTDGGGRSMVFPPIDDAGLAYIQRLAKEIVNRESRTGDWAYACQYADYSWHRKCGKEKQQ